MQNRPNSENSEATVENVRLKHEVILTQGKLMCKASTKTKTHKRIPVCTGGPVPLRLLILWGRGYLKNLNKSKICEIIAMADFSGVLYTNAYIYRHFIFIFYLPMYMHIYKSHGDTR
jgi:hypothetical protein